MTDNRQRRRSRFAVTLLVIGAILLPLAGLSLWARNQLLDTDRYLRTVAPLASDPAIQAAVADRVAEAVVAAADLEARAEEYLPDRAKILAPVIGSATERIVRDVAAQLVASEQFEALWERANRAAHEQVVALLEGKDVEHLEVADGQVVVTFGQLAERLATRLDAIVPLDLARLEPERLNVRFVLVQSEDLDRMQELVGWFNRLTWVLIGLAIACLAAGAVLHPDRRRGLRRAGIAVVVSMSVLLALYALARDRYLDELPPEVQHPDAAAAVFDIVTRYIKVGGRVLFGVGLVLFATGWLLDRSARTARSSDAAVPTWVAGHARALRAAIAGVAVVAVLLMDQPSAGTIAWLAVLVLAALLTVTLLTRVAGSPSPPDAARPSPGGVEPS